MNREQWPLRTKLAWLLPSLFLIAGCGLIEASRIDEAITEYQSVANKIHLGDDKDHVLAVLNPIQERLLAKERKAPESYLKDSATVEIYFVRSARQPDGLTTDDEFTPYVFTNSKLTAIGWATLGGPKTQGQASRAGGGGGGGRMQTTCIHGAGMTNCF